MSGIKDFLLKLINMSCFKPVVYSDTENTIQPKDSSLIKTIDEPIKKFNLDNVTGNFYVKSVYDGDTITILIPMNISIYNYENDKTIGDKSISNPENKIHLYEIRVRLHGIDTPEMKPSKNLPDRENHIKKAHEAKDYLSSIILNKIIKIEFMENDKYGRPLCKLYDQQNNQINKLMIEKGHAKDYSGGTNDTNF